MHSAKTKNSGRQVPWTSSCAATRRNAPLAVHSPALHCSGMAGLALLLVCAQRLPAPASRPQPCLQCLSGPADYPPDDRADSASWQQLALKHTPEDLLLQVQDQLQWSAGSGLLSQMPTDHCLAFETTHHCLATCHLHSQQIVTCWRPVQLSLPSSLPHWFSGQHAVAVAVTGRQPPGSGKP